ncbi:type 1 fimbrial protein [Enterobacteriaceae bacterium 89]|nr:type 1 fimbrial protein [Enterobacteriaceae bacterium 89]
MKFLFLLLLSVVPAAYADVSCEPFSAAIPRTDTVTLAPVNISAGVDMPNGTVIYRGSWNAGRGGTSIRCFASSPPEPLNFRFATAVHAAPLGLSAWNSGPWAQKVFNTGIPGLGVAITFDNVAVTTSSVAFSGLTSVNIPDSSFGYAISNSVRQISLIKTGQLEPGSWSLSAANLPSLKLYFMNRDGMPPVPGFPITTNIVQFEGSITISAQSCTTPDINVTLGNHDVSNTFRGPGSVTPWVKTGMRLENCPPFYGYYNNDNVVNLFDYNQGGAGSVPSSTSNSVGVRVTPNHGVINAAQGIMQIDSSVSGAASGVGIQLGWGDETPAPLDLNSEKKMPLPKDGRTSVDIPLQARYIQTAENLRPGKANGRMTFTVNYY